MTKEQMDSTRMGKSNSLISQKWLIYLKNRSKWTHIWNRAGSIFWYINISCILWILLDKTLKKKQVAVKRRSKRWSKEKETLLTLYYGWKDMENTKNHMMHWNSPWGDDSTGWHIECSTMSCGLLGEFIDIHTGGSWPHISTPPQWSSPILGSIWSSCY